MFSCALLLAFVGLTAASQPGLLFGRSTYSGVATFNSYASQSNTVCGPKSGISGTYGAAAGDISPNVSGGKCYANINPSKCNGQNPVSGYEGPGCPRKNCGLCYKVTNQGGYGGSIVGGHGKSIIVQIIDSCPAESAYNFCKTDVPAQERCGSSETNSLDIDQSAYQALTGTSFRGGVPNLNIDITPVGCP